jgi:hypothetical protein
MKRAAVNTESPLSKKMIIQLPSQTESIEKNPDLRPRWKAEDNKVIVEFDSPSDN